MRKSALVANIRGELKQTTKKKTIGIAIDEPFLVFRHYYIVVFRDLLLRKRDTTYTPSSKSPKAVYKAKSPLDYFSKIIVSQCEVVGLCMFTILIYLFLFLLRVLVQPANNFYCTQINIIDNTYCFMSRTSVILMSPSNTLPLKCSSLFLESVNNNLKKT